MDEKLNCYNNIFSAPPEISRDKINNAETEKYMYQKITPYFICIYNVNKSIDH